jgi:hypothetical protein
MLKLLTSRRTDLLAHEAEMATSGVIMPRPLGMSADIVQHLCPCSSKFKLDCGLEVRR